MDKFDLAQKSTDPKELELLSKDSDYYIRRYVARNPNTSKETLDYLSKHGDYIVKCYVAKNTNSSKETLDYLSKDSNYNIRCNVAANTNTSKETLDYLSKAYYVIRYCVARNPNTSKETLDYLSKDSDLDVRCNVAANTNTSKETLTFLLEDKNKYVVTAAEENLNSKLSRDEIIELAKTSLDAKLLCRLAKIDDDHTRYLIAKNPNTSKETLDYLSKDSDWYIRCCVAKNPNTSKETLEYLLKDNDDGVKYLASMSIKSAGGNMLEEKETDISRLAFEERVALAQISTNSKELELLSKDSDYYIRRYVGKNPNTLIEILEQLSKDSDDDVRFNAASSIMIKSAEQKIKLAETSTDQKELYTLSKDSDLNVKCYVAKNTNTSKEVLEQLSKDSDSGVRYYVARNINTSKETLDYLSKHKDYIVKCYVARNINTSKETLDYLSKDANADVAKSAKNNPNFTKEDVFDMSKLTTEQKCDIAKTSTDPKELELLSKDIDYAVKCIIGLNTNTSKETLDYLSKDSNYSIRCNVSLNPNTSKETLDYLSKDSYSVIRCYVAKKVNTSKEALEQLSKDAICSVANAAKISLEKLSLTNQSLSLDNPLANDKDYKSLIERCEDFVGKSKDNSSSDTTETLSQKLKSNANNALYRVATKQITKGTKLIALSLFDKYSINNTLLAELLKSEISDALFSFLIGFGLSYIPKFKNDVRAQKLAKEFRIEALTTGGNLIFEEIVKNLLPTIVEAASSLPQQEPIQNSLQIKEDLYDEFEDSISYTKQQQY